MDKPTAVEHAEHLRSGVGDICLVCDHTLSGEWTDYNGQVRCAHCGTTYQILGNHLSDAFLAELGLKPEEVAQRYCDVFPLVPVLRLYYLETARQIPFGSYFGHTPIPADDFTNFYQWMAKKAAVLRPQWEDSFNWDVIMERYAN